MNYDDPELVEELRKTFTRDDWKAANEHNARILAQGDESTRLRNWIAEHRKVCPVMRESAAELFVALADESQSA